MFRFFMRLAGVCALLIFASDFASAVSYYTAGHTDLRLGVGGTLNLDACCDGSSESGGGAAVVDGVLLYDPTAYAPADIVVCIPQSTYNYAGYWFGPQGSGGTYGAGMFHAPYFGLGAEQMTYGVFQGNVVDFTLLAMKGPSGGQFTITQSGYPTYMDTTNGISAVDKVANFPVYGHDHYKWSFTQPGVYHLTFQSSATRISTGQLETDVDTFTFLVGTATWKGTKGTDWNEPGNWTESSTTASGVPGYGSTVIFTTSSAAHQPLNQNIGAPLDLHGIIFTTNAGAFQLGGQSIRLSVDSPEISSESPYDQQIGNPLEMAADTTFAVNGSGRITLSGEISGDGLLIKTGPGTLVINNSGSYQGDTVIKNGVLALDAAGQIESSTLLNDATFQILAGDHAVTSISGGGDTEVLSGSLAAGSICQDPLTIGGGKKFAAVPAGGTAFGDKACPVPEPHSLGMAVLGLLSLLAGRFRRKRRLASAGELFITTSRIPEE
jgi:surface-anchored protein